MMTRRSGINLSSAVGSSSPSSSSADESKRSRGDDAGILSLKKHWASVSGYMNSTRLAVLVVLCLQNSLYTTLRRYSQGVRKETYSKNELLVVAELIKIVFSAWMIHKGTLSRASSDDGGGGGKDGGTTPASKSLPEHLLELVKTSKKMSVLALIYGTMNVLSFVSLRNISAGMFTIFAQTKILTTAVFSTIILQRKYSWTKWRALISLMVGVLIFSEPMWGGEKENTVRDGNALLGTVAVLIEVSLSGFASIYFEKVVKTDALKVSIWERNFQLAFVSFPVYITFILVEGGGKAGYFGGWSLLAVFLSALGAAGGLLVALSIKHGDSILKTLATTGAIVLTGLLDSLFLGGPMNPAMVLAAVQVIVAICNYTFDATTSTTATTTKASTVESGGNAGGATATPPSATKAPADDDTEMVSLLINQKV